MSLIRIRSPFARVCRARRSLIPALLGVVAVFTFTAGGRADVTPEAGMLRYPAVSKSHIAFIYANDIWLVSRDGGQAVPLASPPGQETNPRFSPDGTTIAFVGNYEGRRDLYTIPVQGGVAHRVTYHPSSMNLNGWTPDGRLMYASNFESGQRRAAKLYRIDADGGAPEKLPVPYGDAGTISPDGTWLAYTPYNRDVRTWKRYRGGFASDIWLFNLEDHTSKQITDWEGTDTLPMWHRDKVYYLSDRGDEARLNIWSYDTSNERHEQITRFSEWDVKWPSIGPGANGRGEIVFQNGPDLYLLDLENNSSKTVEVTIPGDRPKLMEQRIDAADFIQTWDISPNAKRALVQARGDVWTLPAEHGSPRNLSRTAGIAERMPSWSPDARWIAYFSDETGEYELYITQSDGRGETKQLTTDGGPYKYNPQWSPDSRHIVFTDKTSTIWLHTIETGETKKVDWDPWGRGGGRTGGGLTVSWSHDSRWITYAKTFEDRSFSAIWVYNVESGEHHQLTSGWFDDRSPVFDRDGDWLFFSTSRNISGPIYSDLDTTWIYTGSTVLAAVPLREDVENPWLPESDQEEWEDDEEDEDEDKQNGDADDAENGDDADNAEDDDENGASDDEQPEVVDDGVSGTWEGTVDVPEMGGAINVSLVIALASENNVTGTLTSPMGSIPVAGAYDPAGKTLSLTGESPQMGRITLDLKIEGETMTGTAGAGGQFINVTFQRTAKPGAVDGEEDADAKKDDKKPVEIEFESFEQRAMRIPVPAGRFGRLAVNDHNHLLFVRYDTPGSSATTGIKLFDLKDEKKQEQSVAAGAMNFEITPDGKKLLIVRGGSATIQNAAAGASGKVVPTGGMHVHVNPREEWRQLVTDAWRIQRDFFYVDNMHGVDWPKMLDHYLKMVDDAASREDISFIIGELIAELNVGHAYYWGGDLEREPSFSVGVLGCDFVLDEENNAYRIGRIYEGGVWDIDARSPLSQPGVKVNEGDYLLEVNGLPVDPEKDPYASFQGLAGRTVTLTVSEKPIYDEEARDVVIEPLADDGALRYRAWVEDNRRYVEEQTDGNVGYIHVPNTGVEGQTELVRQFYTQLDKAALIVDERWNGGGQIPTRFIELLNRPLTNYWARRDNIDWKWPPDSHQGPKCMLINGPSGSGGDMFPWLFRQAELGPLVGRRTWGGLVGISGNPALIDGGYTAVPTFGFYTVDGQWSIEGHGVDPDVDVIDDPALMVDGGDPQLDRAIELMLEAIEANPVKRPQRPAPPDRSGFGIDPAHQ